jgi:hypothetical protein
MRIAAATIAVTIAAGLVGFVAADHTLPDSRELRRVSTEFLPKGATNVETGMSIGPQITAGPPRGSTSWRNGPSLDVILMKARADGWEVKTEQIFQASRDSTIVRGPISANISVLQNGDGTATVLRDEDSMNLRRRGAAVVGGAIGFVAMTIRRRRQRPPTMPATTPPL